MWKQILMPIAVLPMLCGLLACGSPESTESDRPVLILAATSLAGPLDTAGIRFGRLHDVTVRIGYGASGTLAQQIRSGAPADLFLTADTAWLDRLIATSPGLVVHWWPWLNSHLVVVAPAGQRFVLNNLTALADPGIGRVVIADPHTAPVGRYAEAALKSAGVLDALDGRLLYAEHASAVVNTVRTGAAGAGLVYATDAVGFPDLQVLYTVPRSLHPAIVYGLAVIGSGAENPVTQKLAEFLRSGEVLDRFSRRGFEPFPRRLLEDGRP